MRGCEFGMLAGIEDIIRFKRAGAIKTLEQGTIIQLMGFFIKSFKRFFVLVMSRAQPVQSCMSSVVFHFMKCNCDNVC